MVLSHQKPWVEYWVPGFWWVWLSWSFEKTESNRTVVAAISRMSSSSLQVTRDVSLSLRKSTVVEDSHQTFRRGLETSKFYLVLAFLDLVWSLMFRFKFVARAMLSKLTRNMNSIHEKLTLTHKTGKPVKEGENRKPKEAPSIPCLFPHLVKFWNKNEKHFLGSERKRIHLLRLRHALKVQTHHFYHIINPNSYYVYNLWLSPPSTSPIFILLPPDLLLNKPVFS